MGFDMMIRALIEKSYHSLLLFYCIALCIMIFDRIPPVYLWKLLTGCLLWNCGCWIFSGALTCKFYLFIYTFRREAMKGVTALLGYSLKKLEVFDILGVSDVMEDFVLRDRLTLILIFFYCDVLVLSECDLF